MKYLRVVAADLPAEASAPRLTGGLTYLMTLREFFDAWYLPVLLTGERDSKPGTVAKYRQALTWWERLTGDPPLCKVNEFTIARFQAGLREGTYRRAMFGRQDHPLRPQTQYGVLKQVKAIFGRIGPTYDPSRPAKRLLERTPFVRLPTVDNTPKACFTLAQARAIVAAAECIDRPSIPGIATRDWWRGWVALHYFTGQRTGTIRQLTWGHVKPDGQGQRWIEIPAELVSKTDKEARVIVHPQLLAALLVTRRTDSPAEPLVFYPVHHRNAAVWHERLQLAAGIPAANCLSPHAWRRTHADQLAQLGLAVVTDLCRRTLDHSDARTTTGHYVDLANKFRLRLPELF